MKQQNAQVKEEDSENTYTCGVTTDYIIMLKYVIYKKCYSMWGPVDQQQV